jgi:hypothetical protein
MEEQTPFQNKLIEVMKEMIETGELTFTPHGGAILRYPGPAKTKTLFFSFFPDSDSVSVEIEEISSNGHDIGVLPQICGTLNNTGFPVEHPTGKISNIYGQCLN